jgi:phosphopantetheinyl transferase
VAVSWDERGRPLLPGTPLCVSASSAGDLGLVAIARVPVGVDVLEIAEAGAAREAARSLPLREDAAPHAAGLPPDLLGLRLWTQVEATLKAAGLDLGIAGVASHVRAAEWRPDGPCSCRLDLAGYHSHRFGVEPMPVPEGFIASLAVAPG